MAVFGFPVAHEDDPARAALAAIRMRDAIDRLAGERKVPVRLKVGIHAGTVVAAPVGAGAARSSTVIGDAVNVAARIQNLAAPGQILATEPVYAAAPDRFVWRKQAPVSVKGREAPVLVYDLMRENPDAAASSGFQGAAWRGRAPLVGRAVELDLLERACRLAESGEGQVVTLIGEAGIGKSRLIYELFETRLNRWGGLLASGRALSYARTTAYQLFRDVVSTLLGMDKAPSADAADALRAAVEAVGLPVATAAALAPVLSMEIRDAAFDALPPEERKRRTIEAVVELAIARSRAIPVVLRLEDLHWIDPALREILAALARRIRDARIAILAVGRPGFAPPWGTETPSTQITLRELSRSEGIEMIRSLLGSGESAAASPLPAEIEKAVVDRAEGNPLFVEETIAALIAAGVIARAAGPGGAGWRLMKNLADAPIPTTLQGIVLSRYDRLPPPTRMALAAASVLGRFFSLDHVARLVAQDLDAAEAASMLAPAVEARIVLVQKTFPRRVYVFKHVLAQETIYGNLLEADRKRLHAAAADALEADADAATPGVWTPGVATPGAEAIAYHRLRSGEPARAVPFLMAVGKRAAELYTHDVAIENFRTAADVALRANDFAAAAEALIALGRSRVTTGNLREAVEDYRRAASIAAENGIVDLEAQARYGMGKVQRRLGENDAAEENIRAALGSASRSATRTPEAAALEVEATNALMLILFDKGETAEARSLLDRGMALARDGHPKMVPYFLNRKAEILEREGDLDGAERHYRESLALCEASGDRHGEAFCIHRVARLEFRRGRFAEAVRLLNDGLDRARTAGDRICELWALVEIAAVELRLGRLAEAADIAARAFEMSRAMGYRTAEVGALGTLASAERRQGRLTEALEMEKQAYTIVQETGDRRLIPRQALRLATAYKDVGIFAEARRRYDEALAGAREMNDAETEARALIPLANIAHDRGRYREAMDFLDRSLDLAGRLGLAVHESFTHTTLVRVAGDLGLIDRVEASARRAMELFDRLQYDDLKPWALVCEARRRLLVDDGPGAVAASLEAIEVAERLGYKRFLVVGHYEAGVCIHFGFRDADRQTEHLEKALALAEEIGEKHEYPHLLIHLAANIARKGGLKDPGRPRRLLERCLALTEPQGLLRHVWRAHRHLAEIDRQAGDEAAAHDHDAKAVAGLRAILDLMPADLVGVFLDRGARGRWLAETAARLAEAGRPPEGVEKYLGAGEKV